MSNPQGSVRKAAVLVASLDSKSADALLEQMTPDQASHVRSAVMELGEISPAEQDQVIQEFMQVGPLVPGDQHAGIELDDSLVARLASSSEEERPGGPAGPSADDPPPFRFLHEATGDTIVALLKREGPQTVAVVLSRLSADRAAEVLTHLPASTQTEAIRRVVHLDETDPEIVREIEQELDSRLSEQMNRVRRRSTGLATMTEILKAADQSDRKDVLANLAGQDSRLADRLGYQQSLAAVPSRKRVRFQGYKAPDAPAAVPSTPSPPETPAWQATAPPVEENRVACKFEDLSRLDDLELGKVLQAADPETAILALTGASPEFADRILKRLPSRDAQMLRQRMEVVGPIRLRDMESAQQELALLAETILVQP